jgi:hypothetical protein
LAQFWPNDSFYGQEAFPGARHLKGLGDKGFVGVQGPNGATLKYVKDGKTYAFAYLIQGAGATATKPRAPQMVKQLEAAVRRAYERS